LYDHVSYHTDNHRVLVDVVTDRTFSVEEFSRKGLVDDGHSLRIWTVCIRECPAQEDWNLQCSEIVWRYVDLAGHDLLSCFLAVTKGYPAVQGSLIWHTEADSSMLDFGNLPHGGGARVQQFSESCRVVISRIIQGRLRGHHSRCIESRVQG